MLKLGEIPFFGELSQASLERLAAVVSLHEYRRGEIIARIGEPGRYLQAIASGAVRVQTNTDRAQSFVLGPGQIFGEMSLFTGMPVSATVIAERDTRTWRMTRDSFLRFLDEEPLLHHSLTRLLIERLRYRTRTDAHAPGLALITSVDGSLDTAGFAEVLGLAVQRYSAGSQLFPAESSGGAPLDDARITAWRAEAASGAYLIVSLTPDHLRTLTGFLSADDVVLELAKPGTADQSSRLASLSGAADHARVLIGDRPRRSPGRWCFTLSHEEIEKVRASGAREYGAVLDHLARYVTYKEVGVALSSGAARGFAHAGALEALEETGIPIDFLCGVSMGGIVAVTMAASSSAKAGTETLRELIGANAKVKDRAWWPRASIYSGSKVRTAAERAFGDATFADLRIPAAVVASDLTSRERAVLDQGPIVPAVLGTSAIPGFFPPVKLNQRLMVDGAIVSRVPVDLLGRRRCGLRIAINVVGRMHDAKLMQSAHAGGAFEARLRRLLGFKHVLGASWELLGSWGSNQEALQADLIIAPDIVPVGSHFDFDRCDEMIACGRAATDLRRDAIVDTVRNLLSPPLR